MKKNITYMLLAICLIPSYAVAYEMGESVTITITVEAYPLIDIEEFCSKPDAPPECKKEDDDTKKEK